ncbi:hypothetical protein E2C01_046335 [Portunus trituberculatus]|uniref:Uncharacterized protein n=1 Tax=Portunus trituberculatus TaxID=210409 RepID=A0A5B7G4Y1_PORTR|nr:hypothetical protein [Portunus trituberculatus]
MITNVDEDQGDEQDDDENVWVDVEDNSCHLCDIKDSAASTSDNDQSQPMAETPAVEEGWIKQWKERLNTKFSSRPTQSKIIILTSYRTSHHPSRQIQCQERRQSRKTQCITSYLQSSLNSPAGHRASKHNLTNQPSLPNNTLRVADPV